MFPVPRPTRKFRGRLWAFLFKKKNKKKIKKKSNFFFFFFLSFIQILKKSLEHVETSSFVRLFNIKKEERKYRYVLRFYGQCQGEILCPSSFIQLIN